MLGEIDGTLPELEPALVPALHDVAVTVDATVGVPERVRGVRGRHRALDDGRGLVQLQRLGFPGGRMLRHRGREHLHAGDVAALLWVRVRGPSGDIRVGRLRGGRVGVAAEVEAEPAALPVLRSPHQ